MCRYLSIIPVFVWWCVDATQMRCSRIYNPTSDFTVFAMGGIDVNITVIVPKRLIDKLDKAAALGSDRNSRAVATAEEFAPRVTPRVT